MLTDEQFTQIAQRHMNTVYRVAMNWLKDPETAKDVTQNALLQLYRTEKEFESDSHVKNWLIRVTVNECKKVFRTPWHRMEDIDDYSEKLSAEHTSQNELLDSVMKLDRKYRVPIYLYYYEEYSIKEIASILAIPENTVKTRLARAKKLLRAYLEDSI